MDLPLVPLNTHSHACMPHFKARVLFQYIYKVFLIDQQLTILILQKWKFQCVLCFAAPRYFKAHEQLQQGRADPQILPCKSPCVSQDPGMKLRNKDSFLIWMKKTAAWKGSLSPIL